MPIRNTLRVRFWRAVKHLAERRLTAACDRELVNTINRWSDRPVDRKKGTRR